ncbi:hypothetical protein RKD42_005932 [Streptomyces ambofaciens]
MIAPLPLKWLYRTGWLYSISAASRRVVTASQPSASARSRAAVTISRSRSARSRSRRVWIVIPVMLAALANLSPLC